MVIEVKERAMLLQNICRVLGERLGEEYKVIGWVPVYEEEELLGYTITMGRGVPDREEARMTTFVMEDLIKAESPEFVARIVARKAEKEYKAFCHEEQQKKKERR